MSQHKKRELLRLARNGHTRRLRTLLDDGVDVNFLHRKTGMTPLMTAAYAGHIDAVKLLLQSGASPKFNADDGATALHWASRNGHLEIVNMLLNADADVNVRREHDGPTPLHMALGHAHDSIALVLIDAGASLEIKCLGKTVVEYAEWCKRDIVVQYIHERRFRHAAMPT
jgi:ankyrin repeat protein